MNRPKFRHPLVLEAPEYVPDGAGGFSENWIVKGTLWGELRSERGGEYMSGGTSVSRVSHKIRVRASEQGAESRPTARQRFRSGERVFHIVAVQEADVTARYLVCRVREEVTA